MSAGVAIAVFAVLFLVLLAWALAPVFGERFRLRRGERFRLRRGERSSTAGEDRG